MSKQSPVITPEEKARRYHAIFPQVPEQTILHWLTLDGMSERAMILFMTTARRAPLEKVEKAAEEFAKRKREEGK